MRRTARGELLCKLFALAMFIAFPLWKAFAMILVTAAILHFTIDRIPVK